jgi:hypothetical protein
MRKRATIIYGDLAVERDDRCEISITRQSTGQRVTLSISEWTYLCQLLDVLTLPVAPPEPAVELNVIPF